MLTDNHVKAVHKIVCPCPPIIFLVFSENSESSKLPPSVDGVCMIVHVDG